MIVIVNGLRAISISFDSMSTIQCNNYYIQDEILKTKFVHVYHNKLWDWKITLKMHTCKLGKKKILQLLKLINYN